MMDKEIITLITMRSKLTELIIDKIEKEIKEVLQETKGHIFKFEKSIDVINTDDYELIGHCFSLKLDEEGDVCAIVSYDGDYEENATEDYFCNMVFEDIDWLYDCFCEQSNANAKEDAFNFAIEQALKFCEDYMQENSELTSNRVIQSVYDVLSPFANDDDTIKGICAKCATHINAWDDPTLEEWVDNGDELIEEFCGTLAQMEDGVEEDA